MEINKDDLPIFYRNRLGSEQNKSAFLIGVEIAHINFSPTLKVWYVYYKNISDAVSTFETKKQVDEDIKHKVVDFLEDVLNIQNGKET